MRWTSGAPLVALTLTACGGVRLPPPPPVFPLQIVWSVPLGGPIEGGLASDGRLLFAAARDGTLSALDPEHGTLVWRSQVPGRLAATEGSLVVREPDGMLVRLEPDSGVVRWRTASGVAGALPAGFGPERVFVAGKGAAAIDRVSGQLLWAAEDGAEAGATPVFAGERLLVGERDGVLRARDATSGRTLWTAATGSELLASPVLDDRGRLLLGTTDRRFLALSLAKGKQLWRWRLGADVQTPAAVLGPSVLFGSHEGVLYALNRRNGNLRWRTPLPSRPRSGPLLLGSAVIVACFETDLVGFDGVTGKRLGTFKVASTFATEPVLIGSRIFVGLRDRGTIVALDLARPAHEASPSAAPPDPSHTPPPHADEPAPRPSASTAPSPAASPTPSPAAPAAPRS